MTLTLSSKCLHYRQNELEIYVSRYTRRLQEKHSRFICRIKLNLIKSSYITYAFFVDVLYITIYSLLLSVYKYNRLNATFSGKK